MFDCARQYDDMLNEGISLSGENKYYFILGRLCHLIKNLPSNFIPKRILDFGCGIGDTTKMLSELFPEAEVVGFDTSEMAINYARDNFASVKISFTHTDIFSQYDIFDLCYTNGVFHHILPNQRFNVIQQIRQIMVPEGYFAFFENNPWNLGTRLIMHRIPFDKEANPISPPEAHRLLRQGGFSIQKFPFYLFYFPRLLAFLRAIEPYLVRLPFGAQYYIIAKKKA